MRAVISLRHAGIVVRDLEAGQAFYERVLGLCVVSKKIECGAFLDTVLGSENVRVTIVKMAAQDGIALLELLCFHSPVPNSDDREVRFYSLGPTHVAFTVNDVAQLRSAIIEAGGTSISPPQLSGDGKALVAFCKDCEGNLLELVQVL